MRYLRVQSVCMEQPVPSLDIESLTSIAQISAAQWDELLPSSYPFACHGFLYALEESGSVTAATGWQPAHLTATLIRSATNIAPGSAGRAFGAIPLFVDSLSNRMALRVDAPNEVRPQTDL